MNRRILLATVPCALALAACTSTTTPVSTQVTNALTVGQTIDQALLKIFAAVSTSFPAVVASSVVTTTVSALTWAGQAISSLLAAAVPPPGASTLTTIDTYFNDALNAAAPILAVVDPVAAPIILVLKSIDALLPVFEAIVPVAAAARYSPKRMALHMATVQAGITPDQALVNIQAFLRTK